MAAMLGNSRTWRWALCSCRICRRDRPGQSEFYLRKRTARNRETRLWRREQV